MEESGELSSRMLNEEEMKRTFSQTSKVSGKADLSPGSQPSQYLEAKYGQLHDIPALHHIVAVHEDWATAPVRIQVQGVVYAGTGKSVRKLNCVMRRK